MLALGVSNLGLSSSQKRAGLTIGQLLPAGLNRVAAIYTDPARPGYDECIQQNRKALGPERVLGGWVTPVGNDNVTTQVSPTSFTTVGGTTATRVAAALLTGFTPGRTVWVMARMTTSIPVGSVQVYAREGSNPGAGTLLGNSGASSVPGWFSFFFVATSVNANLLFTSSMPGQNMAVENITAMEVTDWSKVVLTDDPFGAVPLFSVMQTPRGRGWLMDRSFGMIRGPELCQDVSIDDAAKWGLTQPTSGSVTVSGGLLTINSLDGSYAAGSHNLSSGIVAKRWYEAVFEVVSVTGGGIRLDAAGTNGPVRTVAGIYVQKFQAAVNSVGVLFVRGGGVSSGAIASLSVKELPGNHMSQPTAAARGDFSARYNFRTASEFLSLAYNASSRAVVTNGYANTVRGQQTAARVVNSDGSQPAVFHRETVAPSVAFAQITTYMELKFPNNDSFLLQIYFGSGSSTGGAYGSMNIVNGVPSPTGPGMVCTPLSDGWHKVVFTYTPSVGSVTEVFTLPAGKEMLVGGSDIRLTSDTIASIPEYQQSWSALDYDDEGFPVYFRPQTDDFAYADIDPAGATKALVIWAGQKMSEAASGMAFEMSANSDGAAGSLRLVIPASNGAHEAAYASRGSATMVSVSVIGQTQYDTPARVLAVGSSDIEADSHSLTLNEQTTVSSSADQGTGTYQALRGYFGSRGGTTSFLNARETVPMLLLYMKPTDPGLPAWLLSRLKRNYAKAAGVTL
jgi:hypothetical protein